VILTERQGSVEWLDGDLRQQTERVAAVLNTLIADWLSLIGRLRFGF
jgi:hypothetical protein